jgi:hypothetical protein
MSCNTTAGASATASSTATTEEGAIGKAVAKAQLWAGFGCKPGSCPGSGQQCGYVQTSFSIDGVKTVEMPNGGIAFRATVTTNGRCECQDMAPGT